MELDPEVKPSHGRGGFILVTVLVITAVGLLFGAGALLLFRFQCQRRIDRQHELEKVYAVRSALNYIRTAKSEQTYPFKYQTWSGRDLGVIAEPVKAIFPDEYEEGHLDMSGMFGEKKRLFASDDSVGSVQYNSKLDYEYGMMSNGTVVAVKGGLPSGKVFDNVKNKNENENENEKTYGIAFTDLQAGVSDKVKWWVNVGMEGTGGWLQEDYGRRYFFNPLQFAYGDGVVYDVMRLCLVRNVTNSSAVAGSQHGWPLRQNERALVFEIQPVTDNASMRLLECDGSGASSNLIELTGCPSLCRMGIQIAGNNVCVFYLRNEASNTGNPSVYVFSDTMQISDETYDYFAKGIFTNAYGRVQAPELRAVFEAEARSDGRGASSANTDFLTGFQVTPAYQYDVFLEHPSGVTNRATVAQKIVPWSRKDSKASVVTYDTHGTDRKGFRQDEREAARSRVK